MVAELARGACASREMCLPADPFLIGRFTMFSLVVVPLSPVLAYTGWDSLLTLSGSFGGWAIAMVGGVLFAVVALGLRYIPNTHVGIVEKLWSFHGSVPEGNIIALNSEAGYQAEL